MIGCHTDQTIKCRHLPMKMRVRGEMMANATLARKEAQMV